MSFFGLTKQFPVVRFLIAGLFWTVGNAGHPSPFLSHAERALYFFSYIPVEATVNAIVERSFRMHIVLVLAMSMRVTNPFVSHMPMDCLFDWAATLVWSNGAIYVRGRSLIHMSVEQCSLRRLREVSIGDSGQQSLSLSVSTDVSDASRWVLDVLINVFFRSHKPDSRSVCFLISGLFWKLGDAGHRSPFLSHAKRALYLFSYIPVEKTCR